MFQNSITNELFIIIAAMWVPWCLWRPWKSMTCLRKSLFCLVRQFIGISISHFNVVAVSVIRIE